MKKKYSVCLVFFLLIASTSHAQSDLAKDKKIFTGVISPATYCAGSAIDVPFTVTDPFKSGNTFTIFTAQLSNARGSFAAPKSIGSLTSISLGIITAILPSNMPAGDGYKIRVISNKPDVVGSSSNAITINPNFSISYSEINCDSLKLPWGTEVYSSGNYSHSYNSTKGCDSLVTFHITINNNNTSIISATACNSYTWNEAIYTASGSYVYHTTNRAGCDSAATLNLTINKSSTSGNSATACNNYTWNGSIYTASGSYVYNTINRAGCDSAATLNLTINKSSTSGNSATACNSYTWNGSIYTTSGSYVYHTTNRAGCDSAATLNLTINKSSASGNSVTACNSYTWNGTIYTASGSYVYHTTNAEGCDSSANLNLTIDPIPTITAGGVTTFCSGGSVTLTASAGANYSWSTGATTSDINVTVSGNYSVIENGCTSSPLTVTVSTSTISGGTCAGNTLKGSINNGTTQSFSWTFNGTPVNGNFSPDGITVAGGNGSGFAANQLSWSSDVFVDLSGNVYISDNNNFRVQKWAAGAASGTTVAGGNGYGSAANQLTYTGGIYIGASGDVYVGDNGNNRVQKWAFGATTGITVAGGNGAGSAANQLNLPEFIHIDSSGALYITDRGNSRIQKWLPGTISGITVAGGNGAGAGANQLNNPYGVFVDNAGYIYIVDADNNRIQKWAAGATSGTTVAGGNGAGSGLSQLNGPIGVFVDPIGNVFVGDRGNNRVVKWTPGATSGAVVAGGNGVGSGVTQLNGNNGLFMDASGSLYVADASNFRIQKFIISGGGDDSTILASAPGTYGVTITNTNGCSAASSVVVNPSPTISVGGDTTFCSGSVTLTASSGASYLWSIAATTQSIIVSSSGNYSVTESGCTSSPVMVTANTVPLSSTVSQWSNVGSAGFSAGWVQTTSIAINDSGTPYVVYEDNGDSNKATVMKYNGSGWITVGNPGFSAGGVGYTSIAISRSGIPYVVYCDFANGDRATVMKYNGSSWVTVGSAGFSAWGAFYTSIAIDGGGTPYVVYSDESNSSKASVMKYNGSSWVTVGSAAFSAGQADYTSIAIDSSDAPYVVYVDDGNSQKATVMKYNGSSWVTVGSAAFSAGQTYYTSIAIDGSGTPYVAYSDIDSGAKATVMKYNGKSWVTVGVAGFSAEAAEYTSIAIDASGTPYVAYGNGYNGPATVMKYNGSSWVTVGVVGFSAGEADYTSIAINGSGTPYVAYGDRGNDLKATVMDFTSTLSPIIGYTSVCASSVQTYSVTAVSGATSYIWTLPAGWSGGSITNSINVTVGNAGGTISVAATNGCGNAAAQSLNVTLVSNSTSSHTACDGYAWNGTTYTASGSYVFHTTNAAGCDSTATLNLTINPSYNITGTPDTVYCGGYYSPSGQVFYSSGDYSYGYRSINGCDSLVTTHVTIYPSSSPFILELHDTLYISNNSSFISYQWYSDSALIPGATNSFFVAVHGGLYGVLAKNRNGCETGNDIDVLICTPPTSPQTITFQKTIGGPANDYGNSVQQTCDGGYIIAGNTHSFGNGSSDLYLVKADENGDILWTKTYGDSISVYSGGIYYPPQVDYDTSYIVRQTSRGYTLLGTSDSGSGTFLCFTDSVGNTLSTSLEENYWNGGNISWYGCALTSNDFNWIAIGSSFGGLIFSGSNLGGPLGGDSIDLGNAVQYTSDGGSIVVGTSYRSGSDSIGICLIKYDALGDTLWTKIYGGPRKETGVAVQQTSDSGYIILGTANDSITGNLDVLLIKTTSTGDALWAQTYGGGSGNDIGYSVQQTKDEGYIVAGSTASFGAGGSDAYLLKTDSAGNALWGKAYGGTGNDFCYSVEQTNDGGYITIGSTNSFGSGGSDIYLIKTDSLGNSNGCSSDSNQTRIPLGCPYSTAQTHSHPPVSVTGGLPLFTIYIRSGGINTLICSSNSIERTDNDSLLIFPNPGKEKFSLIISDSDLEIESINVYNSLGQNIYNEEINNSEAGVARQIQFNAPPGVYLVRVKDKEKEYVKKLVVTF